MRILFVAFCAPRPRNPTFGNFVHHIAKAMNAGGHQTDVLVPVRVFPNVQLFSSMTTPRLWGRVPADFMKWVNHWRDASATVVTDGVNYIYRRFTTLPSTSRRGGNARGFIERHASWLESLVEKNGYTHVVGHFLETSALVDLVRRKVNGGGLFVHEDVDEYCRLVSAERVVRELPPDIPLFANSLRTAQQIRRRLGSREVALAYLGIDHHPRVVQSRMEQPSSPYQITCVSRFTPNKNQELLVRMAARWRSRSGSPQIRINLVGDDGQYRREVEALVKRERVEDVVHFADASNHAVIAGKLAETDVFVFPSRRESFGLVLLEAAAAGVPVLAGRNIGACEDLSRLGWDVDLFDETSPESLEHRLHDMLDNISAARQKAQELQQFVASSFTWRNTASTIADHLQGGSAR